MREPGWRREGTEPDYRFTLANERTFLAWIRTALALLAGGILLDQFATKLEPRFVVVLIATSLCGLATALCLLSYVRWRANEIAMRHGQPMPSTWAIPLLAVCCFAIAAAVVVVLLA